MKKILILRPEREHENEVIVHDHGRLGRHVHAPPGFARNAIATGPSSGSLNGTVTVEMELR